MSTSPEILNLTRGSILADRRAYTVTIRYPRERPMQVTFIGPSVNHGPVTVSFSGITTSVVQPERFGDFGRAWIFRFYGVLGHISVGGKSACDASTGYRSHRVGDVTCPECRSILTHPDGEAFNANARSM